jgi:hypothetical protein
MPSWKPKATCTPEQWEAYLVKNRAKYKRLSAKWRAENPELLKAWDRKSKLKLLYGLTTKQYEAVFNSQGGVCAICQQPPRGKRFKNLCVDHNHTTGINRGLLCSACNMAVGLIEADPDWTDKALNYLARYIEQIVRN